MVAGGDERNAEKKRAARQEATPENGPEPPGLAARGRPFSIDAVGGATPLAGATIRNRPDAERDVAPPNIIIRPMRFPLPILMVSFFSGGCATAPEASPPVASTPAVAVPVGAAPAEYEKAPNETAPGSVAAEETARRLQAGDSALVIAARSRFQAYPTYIASLAGSVILQANTVQRSSATFSRYVVLAIEIHALPDGRVRVWAEFANEGNESRVPRVYCRFNENSDALPVWRTLPVIGPDKRRLISFDSKDANVSRVTVLVR